MTEKDKKYNDYKRKLIGGRIYVPYDLGFAGSSMRENSVIDYYDNYNDHISEVLEQEDILEADVIDILKNKLAAANEVAYSALDSNDSMRADSERKQLEKNINEFRVAIALRKNPTIATHFGDDLDNRSSIHALEKWSRENGIIEENEKLNVERVPAGKVKEGIVNVDTGGHKGSNYEEETIVIDGNPEKGIKSAIQEISENFEDVQIPKQIIECADALPTKISIFDTRSGMSLQKFADIETVFKMAEEGLLTQELTDEQLEKYGLVEAQKEQQKMVDDAKAEVEKYTQKLANGEKIVIAPKFIKAGSLVAYESGVNYYASVDKHKSGEGVTMAINAKEGHMLPENIKEYGHEIVEQLKNEDGSSGAFLHPNGSMFVVGGPKNPDVKLDKTQEEVIDEISQLFKEYSDKEVESQEKEEVPPMPEIDENALDENVKINEFGEIERSNIYNKLIKNRDEKERKEETLNKGKENLDNSRKLINEVENEIKKENKNIGE